VSRAVLLSDMVSRTLKDALRQHMRQCVHMPAGAYRSELAVFLSSVLVPSREAAQGWNAETKRRLVLKFNGLSTVVRSCVCLIEKYRCAVCKRG
jgi:hypothetical protein